MAQRRNTLMDPPIEDLLNNVDSKFTLVALSAKRARQINSYYNQLGEGMGMVVPPQVTSVSGKPLTIAFEEVSAGKATYHRPEPGEGDAVEGAEAVADVAEAVAEVVDAVAEVVVAEAIAEEVLTEAVAEVVAEASAPEADSDSAADAAAPEDGQ